MIYWSMMNDDEVRRPQNGNESRFRDGAAAIVTVHCAGKIMNCIFNLLLLIAIKKSFDGLDG